MNNSTEPHFRTRPGGSFRVSTLQVYEQYSVYVKYAVVLILHLANRGYAIERKIPH